MRKSVGNKRLPGSQPELIYWKQSAPWRLLHPAYEDLLIRITTGYLFWICLFARSNPQQKYSNPEFCRRTWISPWGFCWICDRQSNQDCRYLVNPIGTFKLRFPSIESSYSGTRWHPRIFWWIQQSAVHLIINSGCSWSQWAASPSQPLI